MKPIIENKLIDLQLNMHKKKHRDTFILLLQKYSISLIKKILKNKVYIKETIINDYALDVVLKLLEKYKKDKNYKIHSSFAGYLKWKVLEVLFNPNNKAADMEISLNYLEADEKRAKKTKIKEILNQEEVKRNKYLRGLNPLLQEDLKRTIKHLIIYSYQETLNEELTLLLISLIDILFKCNSKTVLNKFLQYQKFPSTYKAFFETFILELKNQTINCILS